MWRFLKIFLISLTTLILLLAGILYWQKDNIIQAVVKSVEDSYQVQLLYEKSNLQLLRSWPDVSFEVQNVSVRPNSVALDSVPILSIGKLGIAVSFWQVWSAPYQIAEIYLDRPTLNLNCDSLGSCNYNVLLNNNDDSDSQDQSTSQAQFLLEKLHWSEARIEYTNQAQNQSLKIQNWNASWFIAYLNNQWTIDMDNQHSDLSFYQNSVALIPNLSFSAKGQLFFDPEKGMLELEDHLYTINGLQLEGSGKVSNLNQVPIMDWSVKMPSNDIESIVSLFPTAFDSYKEELTTQGNAEFEAKVVGAFDAETENYPTVNAQLRVSDGYLKYKSTPQPLENLMINVDITKDQGDLSSLHLIMNQVQGSFGNNGRFDHNMDVYPFSDHKTNKGKTNIQFSASDLYASFPFIDEMALEGAFEFSSKYQFNMAQIENESWDEISVLANLKGDNIVYPDESLVEYKVSKLSANIEQQNVSVGLENVQYGRSFLSFVDFKGPILPYLLGKAKILNGTLMARGKMIDLNPWLVNEAQVDTSVAVSTSNIDLSPYHLDYEFKTDELRYDEYDLTQIQFNGKLKDGHLWVEKMEGIYESTFLQCNGEVGNISGYLNGVSNLRMDFACSGDEFDLWAYMSSEETAQNVAEKEAVEPFRFPEEIDMNLSYKLNKVKYDKINFDRVNGSLSLSKQVLAIQPTRLSTLGGEMSIEGEVKHKGTNQLHYHFDMATKESEFKSAFQSVSMIQKIAPVFKHMFGEFNTQTSIDGDLDVDLAPVLSSISAQGVIETLNARIKDFKWLERLNSIVGEGTVENFHFNRTKNWFSIENGMVFLDPTTMEIGNETWAIEGSHQIEGGINYLFSGPISVGQLRNSKIGRDLWNSVDQTVQKFGGSKIPEDAKINIDIELTGTTTNPSVKIRPLDNMEDQLRGIVKDKKERKKEELTEQFENEKKELERRAEETKKDVKKDITREIKSLADSGKTTSRVDSLKREAEKKTKEVKKKFKKWNPFGN